MNDTGPILRALSRNRVRVGLIVAEIALTLAIVANCVSLIAGARAKMAQPSGFADDDIVSVRTVAFDAALKDDSRLANLRRADLEALRHLPGVKAATNTYFLPWQGGGSSTEMRVAGSQGGMLRTQIYSVDEGTLDTLDTHLVAGRGLTADDVTRDTARLKALSASPRARDANGLPREKFTQDVMVTKAFAQLAFGDPAPLGKMLEDTDTDLYRIVGVVDPFYNPYGWPIHEYAVFYANVATFQGGMPYLVRAEPGQRAQVAGEIEQRLLAVERGRELTIRTLDEVKSGYFANQRITVTLMGTVILLLVFVTSLGIVGLTSFSVTERTRQIGTRRALGARKVDVVTHFLLENWLVTTMGVVLGSATAFALNAALQQAVGGNRLGVPLVAGGALLMWTAGLLATLAPALRASHISPAIATRNV